MQAANIEASKLSELVSHYSSLEAANFATFNECNAANEQIAAMQKKIRATEVCVCAGVEVAKALRRKGKRGPALAGWPGVKDKRAAFACRTTSVLPHTQTLLGGAWPLVVPFAGCATAVLPKALFLLYCSATRVCALVVEGQGQAVAGGNRGRTLRPTYLEPNVERALSPGPLSLFPSCCCLQNEARQAEVEGVLGKQKEVIRQTLTKRDQALRWA